MKDFPWPDGHDPRRCVNVPKRLAEIEADAVDLAIAAGQLGCRAVALGHLQQVHSVVAVVGVCQGHAVGREVVDLLRATRPRPRPGQCRRPGKSSCLRLTCPSDGSVLDSHTCGPQRRACALAEAFR